MNRLKEISKQLNNLFSIESMKAFEKSEEKVELHDDLKECIEEWSFGKSIHHPLLVVAPMGDSPILTTQYNLQYEAKCIQVQNAIENKDIEMFIYLHERPYRHDALLKAYGEWWTPDLDEDYWNQVARVWIDSENIYQNKYSWRSLLTEQYSNPNLMMNEEEKIFFESLPDEITIFRGGMDDKGFSWTLDKDRACWFANRWNQDQEVFEKTINKSDALAYLNGRNESEIIYVPEN